jgi:hypothetical protein
LVSDNSGEQHVGAGGDAANCEACGGTRPQPTSPAVQQVCGTFGEADKQGKLATVKLPKSSAIMVFLNRRPIEEVMSEKRAPRCLIRCK